MQRTKDKFWSMCQETAATSKRCATSPPSHCNDSKAKKRLVLSSTENVLGPETTPRQDIHVSTAHSIGVYRPIVQRPQAEHSYFLHINNAAASSSKKSHKAHIDVKHDVQHDHAAANEILSLSLVRDNSPLNGSITLKERDNIASALNSLSVITIANAIVKNLSLCYAIQKLVLEQVNKSVSSLSRRNPNYGYISKLMTKDYSSLANFTWSEVVREMADKIPELLNIMLALTVGDTDVNAAQVDKVLPRLGMAYAILIQARHHELSRIQRILTLCLHDNVCEQKVFDRLQPIGVSLSYCTSLCLLEEVGGHFNDKVVEAVKQGQKFRIIGDNLNFSIHVQDMRMDKQNSMRHMFASAIILQPRLNLTTLDHVPQCNIDSLSLSDVIISYQELEAVKLEYVKLICDIVADHVPSLAFLKQAVPLVIKGPHTDQLACKSEVIALPVLPFNEQLYSDDVKILSYYEDLIHDIYHTAGLEVNNSVKIPIGGDQLTRERLSHAKRLRIDNFSERDRFDHLGPTTFELFHLDMNYLEKIVFKWLYNDNSSSELGTMKCEQQRIMRKNVDPDVHKAFDADQAFVVSFIRSYIVALALDFFGMDSPDDVPSKNLSPIFQNNDERSSWVYQTIGKLVQDTILDKWCGKKLTPQVTVPSDNTVTEYLPITLKNGGTLILPICQPEVVFEAPKEDYVKNYSHLVLDVGLLYLNFLDSCHVPNRDRMMRIFKMMLPMLKGSNNLSKYALELLRFLIQHMSILTESESYKVFYGLFVNNRGHIDTFIRADQQMEYIVKEQKKLIKHSYSNKSEENILRHTAAVHGVATVAKQFDAATNVLVRSKAHHAISAIADEREMIKDLCGIKPFKHEDDRKHNHFPTIQPTLSEMLDGYNFLQWFVKYKSVFLHEVGK